MAMPPSREASAKFSTAVLPLLSTLSSTTLHSNITSEEAMKQRELEEFYATYNVWTGIRTAATLSMIFLFTVTVIIYKSKCKRHRKYELYPSLEDLPGRPLDYYDYWPTQISCGDNVSNHSRRSDDKDFFCRIYDDEVIDETGSAPLPTLLLGEVPPSLRNSFRVKSLPGSVMRMNLSRMNSLEKDEGAQYVMPSFRREFLRVPGVRFQSTESSSDGYSIGSSTYDLPYDATPMTLLGIPGMSGRSKPLLQTGGIDWEADQATAEWLQTIDINVIQATPNVSPCGSVRSISDNVKDYFSKLAISSRSRSASLASTISQDYDAHSIGSDSVFLYEHPSEHKRTGSGKKGTLLDAKSSNLPAVSPQPFKRKQTTQRQVHSFRLPIGPKAASSPIPAMLEGQPLQRVDFVTRNGKDQGIGSNLGLPLGIHLSASCERLAAHESLKQEHPDSSSQKSSTCSLQPGNSFEGDPVVTSYVVPNLRRVNSVRNIERRSKLKEEHFRRANSDTTPMLRSDSAEMNRQNSNSSSSSTEEASDSVSFHLMVPHLSFDYPSNDTSRASSPSLSPTPPDSPALVASLNVPIPMHRSTSPSRGRVRYLGSDGRGVLKRQYSQYVPSSPREKPPSPFLLPTSFEEDEELLETAAEDLPQTHSPAIASSSSTASGVRSKQDQIDSLAVRETKF